METRVLSWNIQQGGGRRKADILPAIRDYKADVLVLSEVRRTSAPLVAAIREAGWVNHTDLPEGRYGVAAVIFAKGILRPVGRTPISYRWRFVEAELPDSNVTVGAIYGLLNGEDFNGFWSFVRTRVSARLAEPYLLTGDFNTGRSLVDAPKKNFFCSRHFEALHQDGLVDLWRRQHGDRVDHTYYHRRKNGERGNGFRIDHALGSASLALRIVSVDYDHAPRERKISDHSALRLDIRASV